MAARIAVEFFDSWQHLRKMEKKYFFFARVENAVDSPEFQPILMVSMCESNQSIC